MNNYEAIPHSMLLIMSMVAMCNKQVIAIHSRTLLIQQQRVKAGITGDITEPAKSLLSGNSQNHRHLSGQTL